MFTLSPPADLELLSSIEPTTVESAGGSTRLVQVVLPMELWEYPFRFIRPKRSAPIALLWEQETAWLSLHFVRGVTHASIELVGHLSIAGRPAAPVALTLDRQTPGRITRLRHLDEMPRAAVEFV